MVGDSLYSIWAVGGNHHNGYCRNLILRLEFEVYLGMVIFCSIRTKKLLEHVYSSFSALSLSICGSLMLIVFDYGLIKKFR